MSQEPGCKTGWKTHRLEETSTRSQSEAASPSTICSCAQISPSPAANINPCFLLAKTPSLQPTPFEWIQTVSALCTGTDPYCPSQWLRVTAIKSQCWPWEKVHFQVPCNSVQAQAQASRTFPRWQDSKSSSFKEHRWKIKVLQTSHMDGSPPHCSSADVVQFHTAGTARQQAAVHRNPSLTQYFSPSISQHSANQSSSHTHLHRNQGWHWGHPPQAHTGHTAAPTLLFVTTPCLHGSTAGRITQHPAAPWAPLHHTEHGLQRSSHRSCKPLWVLLTIKGGGCGSEQAKGELGDFHLPRLSDKAGLGWRLA